MLEKEYQLQAFKNLVSAGGMKTPMAITISTNCMAEAKNIADQLAGLILADISYPDTVTPFIKVITDAANDLNAVSLLASSHANLLAANADLSMLLQLNIGWDVYCRANSLEASELPISVAIGDDATPKALMDAVSGVDTAAVVAAMADINQTLNTGTGGSTEGGAAIPPPALTQDQIDALKAACASLGLDLEMIPPARDSLKTQTDKAGESATIAIATYTSAIGTALSEASANNSSTACAVAALVPQSVLDELKKGAA
ncbi:hypothetical protein EX399_10230 [Salmonella enterica]|uniref:hypothetical protein n=1 Tax=Citrobacter braakii TaxID=57706 RepID=UPI00066B7567|nr:hypothetical protein [Citrobacter braakii]EAT1308151.1 hypothetical protein [Salmonella enterica]EFG0523313.1 hypothetical protein [Escherichia coli]